jgi:hypothetical protein
MITSIFNFSHYLSLYLAQLFFNLPDHILNHKQLVCQYFEID